MPELYLLKDAESSSYCHLSRHYRDVFDANEELFGN